MGNFPWQHYVFHVELDNIHEQVGPVYGPIGPRGHLVSCQLCGVVWCRISVYTIGENETEPRRTRYFHEQRFCRNCLKGHGSFLDLWPYHRYTELLGPKITIREMLFEADRETQNNEQGATYQ